ncbi:hypothetical protein H2248_001948 [Termitomyces sp. 'cryptogamus']|nr:hypothetical protein H2248_001948 [Termitomyces sp. 'cryptogamus']
MVSFSPGDQLRAHQLGIVSRYIIRSESQEGGYQCVRLHSRNLYTCVVPIFDSLDSAIAGAIFLPPNCHHLLIFRHFGLCFRIWEFGFFNGLDENNSHLQGPFNDNV